MNKQPISWVWVILALVIFWPVGIILLIKRLSSDRNAAFKGSRLLKVMYIVLFAIGGFTLLGGSVIGLMFIAGGVAIFMLARKNNEKVARYKKYMNLVTNHSLTYINEIAQNVGISPEIAKKELQAMIDMDIFEGAMIDVVTNEIILSPVQQQAKGGVMSAIDSFFSDDDEIEMERVVECESCGAKNKVTGDVGECAHCGTPLD